jgi:hypothetical protein
MADDLYDRDFYAWTQVQAQALRARRSGDNALDFDNLAEEIEDVGKSEFRACQSYVERILEHLVKLEFVGPPEAIPGYKREIRAFRRNLERALTPTIERKVRAQLGELFAEVLGDLSAEELIGADEIMKAKLLGYGWSEVTDPNWFPEQRPA